MPLLSLNLNIGWYVPPQKIGNWHGDFKYLLYYCIFVTITTQILLFLNMSNYLSTKSARDFHLAFTKKNQLFEWIIYFNFLQKQITTSYYFPLLSNPGCLYRNLGLNLSSPPQLKTTICGFSPAQPDCHQICTEGVIRYATLCETKLLSSILFIFKYNTL